MSGKFAGIRGFTLIEVVIVLVIIAILLGTIVKFGQFTYAQYVKTARQASMKTDGANIRELMQGDIDRGGVVAVHPDNRGVTINIRGRAKDYFLRNEAIFVKEGINERKLTCFAVEDATWVVDRGFLTMNVVFRYNNISPSRVENLKIVKQVELKGSRQALAH